jgi:hypothetical protein
MTDQENRSPLRTPADMQPWQAIEQLQKTSAELLDTLEFVRGWFVDNDLDGEYHAIFEQICAAIAKVRRPQ